MLPRVFAVQSVSKPGWVSRLEASVEKNKGIRASSYYQIATIGNNGRPRNRTVVHRQLKRDGRLVFVTDTRSKKVADVREGSGLAEIAWYFAATREQFRIFGSLSFYGEEEGKHNPEVGQERQRAWDYMSDPGRLQFIWPQPGEERNKEDLAGGKVPPGSGEPPPSTFALAMVTPQEVDVVDLVNDTRTLWKKESTGIWSCLEINP